MGTSSINPPSLSRAHSRARKLSKRFGVRWAASFLCALGYSIEDALTILKIR